MSVTQTEFTSLGLLTNMIFNKLFRLDLAFGPLRKERILFCMRITNAQISLRIRAVGSATLLFAQFKDTS